MNGTIEIFSPGNFRIESDLFVHQKRFSINALRVREKIISQCQKLLINPTAGRVIIQTSTLEVRQIMVYKYRVFYKQKNNNIEVISIFHSAQLLENNPGLQRWFDD